MPDAKEKEILEEKYNDGDVSTLTYIHIGKCGGASINRAIIESPIVNKQFTKLKDVHIRNPYYQLNAKYLIVVRNPISRALSAFNWRHYLVVETKQQEFRFPGEYEVLYKYKNMNNFAESLYDESGDANITAIKEWMLVHHLKEDISFYLNPLLPNLKRNNLFAVLTQENLHEDAEKFLGVDSLQQVHKHSDKVSGEMRHLSNIAKSNLKRYLTDDFHCLEKLFEISDASEEQLKILA